MWCGTGNVNGRGGMGAGELAGVFGRGALPTEQPEPRTMDSGWRDRGTHRPAAGPGHAGLGEAEGALGRADGVKKCAGFLWNSASVRRRRLVDVFELEPHTVQVLEISVGRQQDRTACVGGRRNPKIVLPHLHCWLGGEAPPGALTCFPQLQASIRAYARRMSGSLIPRCGNSRSMLSSLVLFFAPHPFLSAIASISPMHAADVKTITSGSPRLNRMYTRRAHSACRVSPSSMFVSRRKRRIWPGGQSSSANSFSIGSSPGQAPQRTIGSTRRNPRSEDLETDERRSGSVSTSARCSPPISASGMVSKILSPTVRALIRRASIRRG